MPGYIGQISLFAGSFAPRGWLLCDGQLLSVQQYPYLFIVTQFIYGGSPKDHKFKIPDLRGRAAMHSGAGPGLQPKTLGQQGGQESVPLKEKHLAHHKHSTRVDVTATINASTEQGDESDPKDRALSKAKIYLNNIAASSLHPGTVAGSYVGDIANTGSGQPVPNMQPYLVLNYMICAQGPLPPFSSVPEFGDKAPEDMSVDELLEAAETFAAQDA